MLCAIPIIRLVPGSKDPEEAFFLYSHFIDHRSKAGALTHISPSIFVPTCLFCIVGKRVLLADEGRSTEFSDTFPCSQSAQSKLPAVCYWPSARG